MLFEEMMDHEVQVFSDLLINFDRLSAFEHILVKADYLETLDLHDKERLRILPYKLIIERVARFELILQVWISHKPSNHFLK